MGMIGDFYVRLSAVTAPYTKSLVEATDEGEAFAEANKTQMEAVKASNESGGLSFGLLGKAAVGIGAAFVGISAVSLKWATDFQSTMETLHTQAGVAQDQIGSLGNGVLALAGQVGFSPNSLAEALYHIESSFASVKITGPQALNLLKIAAEGAAVGHANLVDVTNALDAAIASGIPGVQDFSQTMGVLNSIVGSGDMTMQDLANSFSTGALANVKSYGASITDVGAALAVFGDNNIRGQNAATDLRVSMQALQTPAKSGAQLLQEMGLNAHSLGDEMSKGGLLPALQLLHDKLTGLGYTSKTQGAALTELFGKKAGAGIVVLYDQLDRLKSKYPDLEKGAKNFADAWAATKQTVKQQLNDIGAAAQAAGIKFGQFLLPQVSKLLRLVTSKGGSLFGTLGGELSQFASGFSGAASKPAAPVNFHNSRLNQDQLAAPPPQLTAWQQAGEQIRKIADDFARFGRDAAQGLGDLVKIAQPVAQVMGQGLGTALSIVGKILANVVGPALDSVLGFLASHQDLVKVFAEVILGGLIAKLTILKGIKAATAITDLATSIVKFPFGQMGQIGTAAGGLKTAFGNLKDTGKLFDGIRLRGMYAFDGLKGGLKGLVSTLSQQGSYLKGVLSDMGGKIGGAFKKVLPTKLDAKIFLQSVKDLGGTVASTIKGWGSGIANAASSAASGLSTLVKNAGNALASFGSKAWSAASTAISGIGSSIATAATAAWGWVQAAAASALTAGRAAIAWTADKLALIGAAIAERAAAIGQWLLNVAMDANPITLIILAIIALVGIFVLLWTKCAWFRDFWKQVWDDIKKLFAAAVSFVKSHVDLLVGIIALPLLPLLLLYQHWKQVWSDIKTATADVWNWIDRNVVSPVKRVFTTDIPGALHTAKGIWDTVWDGIKTTVSGVWNWVNNNVFQPIITFHKVAVIGALNAAKGAWDTVWGGIKSTVQTVWGVLSPIFNAISGAISTISGGISSIASTAGSAGGGLWSKLSHLAGFDDGGFVPGAAGAPMLAVVHGGEYVVSNDMLAGRARIDNRALTGVLGSRSGAGSGGSTSALAVTPAAGGGSVTVVNVYVNVAGNVTSERKLADSIRTQILQYNLRNSSNGLSLT